MEQVLAGVKRCRIVLDTLRHWRPGFDDAVMEVACGLHNLRELVRRPVAAGTPRSLTRARRCPYRYHGYSLLTHVSIVITHVVLNE